MTLVEIIKKDIKSKVGKYEGRKFYERKGKGYQAKFKDIVDTEGNTRTIHLNSSTSIDINYFKMLVNQKVNYILSNEVTIEENNYITSTEMTDLLEELVLNASMDTTSWLHFYIEDNKLEWCVVNDSEIIPLHDIHHKKIIGIIRYYAIDDDTLKVEQWNLNGVIVATIKKNDVVTKQELPHYLETTEYNDSIEDVVPKNLPFIPFIPLFNNKLKLSDIDGIDSLLEMYNSINSGLIDNIYKFQEAVALFKGFSGDNKAVENAIRQMKLYKGVGVPQDGSVEYLSIEIPTDARVVILDELKKAIFLIGRGMNPNQNNDGGSLTNVVIKSRYSELDMKVNSTEKMIKLFYLQYIECINKFYNSSVNNDILLNRNQIFNESELIENCLNSLEIGLSLETILENHPWVSNVEDEMLRIREQITLKDEKEQKII